MKPPSGALTPPALLRRKNDSVSPARVEVMVPPGDELEVSEAVADQLGPEFKHPDEIPEPAPQVVRDADGMIDYELTPPEALEAAGLPPAPETDEPAKKPSPRKRATKKAADA